MSIKKYKNWKHPLGCFTVLAMLTFNPALANEANTSSTIHATSVDDRSFLKFVPSPSRKTRLDYSVWDEALQNIVIDLGPSLRKRASKPHATTGSRQVKGHKSPYRLEGSRLTFDYINDTFQGGLTEYRKELESIATRLDVSTWPKTEQLSFWYNLHNVALIEKISTAYPIDRTNRVKIKLGGEKYNLNEAKFISVKGQSLSLRDIRENIVYKNWDNPIVVYGFYRGDIGSPKINKSSYNHENMDYFLDAGAREFVNSLRGFRKGSKYRYVSEIFDEMSRHYFNNGDQSLEDHLLKYAREDVKPEILSDQPFKTEIYDNMIGDLSGGRRLASSGTPLRGTGNISPEIQRFLAEAARKRQILIQKGMISNGGSYVIIEDLDLGPDPTKSDVE